jgi:hypothetical protein
MEVNDYVDKRISHWEADINKSLDLQVSRIEELLDSGYKI